MSSPKIGSVSSIPATSPTAGTEAEAHRRGGETEPSNLAVQIKDPVLRAAFLRAYRAWEKAQ